MTTVPSSPTPSTPDLPPEPDDQAYVLVRLRRRDDQPFLALVRRSGEFWQRDGDGAPVRWSELVEWDDEHQPVEMVPVRYRQLWHAEVRARALKPRDPAKDAAESTLWKHFRLIVERVEAERDAALAKLREYDNTINWNTTCTSCAAVLDSSIRETERAERAESAADRVRALHQHRKARNPFGVEYDECVACGWIDTGKCPTLAALDGTPATAHAPSCEGFHLADISSADATAVRAEVRADPWRCRQGRNGYHAFTSENPSPADRCLNEGCWRTRGELNPGPQPTEDPR